MVATPASVCFFNICFAFSCCLGELAIVFLQSLFFLRGIKTMAYVCIGISYELQAEKFIYREEVFESFFIIHHKVLLFLSKCCKDVDEGVPK